MTGWLPPFLACLTAAIVLAAWTWIDLAIFAIRLASRSSACGPSSRSAGGSSAAEPPAKAGRAVLSRHEVASRYGPQQPIFAPSPPLSSSLPARSQADLGSAARRLDHLPLLAPVGAIAAIDPQPNLSAFSAGVEIGIFTVLFTISSLLVVNWIIKTMWSSK